MLPGKAEKLQLATRFPRQYLPAAQRTLPCRKLAQKLRAKALLTTAACSSKATLHRLDRNLGWGARRETSEETTRVGGGKESISCHVCEGEIAGGKEENVRANMFSTASCVQCTDALHLSA